MGKFFSRHQPSKVTPPPPAEPEPEPEPELEVLDYVVATYPYMGRDQAELSFNKGDILEVISKDNDDWWLAQRVGSQTRGYIPVTFVALRSSLESQDWYFGKMVRMEAEQMLLSELNSTGAFLVRQTGASFCLSIRDVGGRQDQVKHYLFHITTDGSYYMNSRIAFQTMSDLVSHYTTGSDCLVSSPGVKLHPSARSSPDMQDISKGTQEQWEISRSELMFVCSLGKGAFGEVWHGKFKNSFEVAIKQLKEGSTDTKEFLAEAKVMKKLRHPHILPLYAVCTQEEPILIVMEYMRMGSLLDVLRNSEPLNLNLKLYIATQVANGMKYLEGQQLIHRDLAARNILVDEFFTCKVADFGLARVCEGIYNLSSNSKFPVRWTAPEVIFHHTYSTKSDVWSFGILMMEILTDGAVPYNGLTKEEVQQNVLRGIRMPKPPLCPESLYELLTYCWHRDPTNRPTFQHIHDFLENYAVQSEQQYQ